MPYVDSELIQLVDILIRQYGNIIRLSPAVLEDHIKWINLQGMAYCRDCHERVIAWEKEHDWQ